MRVQLNSNGEENSEIEGVTRSNSCSCEICSEIRPLEGQKCELGTEGS